MANEEYRLAAIMFTDIHGFSRMMESNEKATLQLLKYHNNLVSDLVKKHNGNVIKTIGDAFLVVFNNTTNAVLCSIDIQKELYEYNKNLEKGKENLFIRIGVHLGDVYFLENDVLGEGINIASRLQSLSKPGRICISQDVYNQVLNKVNAEFISLGKAKLKNISKEIIAYEIMTDFSDDSTMENKFSQQENIFEQKSQNFNRENVNEQTNQKFDQKKAEEDIVNHIRFFDRRISVNEIEKYAPDVKEFLKPILEKLTEKGVLTKIEKENGEAEYGISDMKDLSKLRDLRELRKLRRLKRVFEDKKEIVVDEEVDKFVKTTKEMAFGFIPHSISFIFVNLLLYFINMATSPGHPWFLYLLGGWSIGLANHFAVMILNIFHLPKLLNNKDASLEKFKLLQKDHNINTGLVGNIVSFITVNAYLIMIYCITSGVPLQKLLELNPTNMFTFFSEFKIFPWFIFPIFGWGIGFVSHFFKFIGDKISVSKQLRLIKKTQKENITINENVRKEEYKTEKKEDKKIVIDKDNFIGQALMIKESLIKKLKSENKIKDKIGLEIIPMIENFINKIKELVELKREIAEVMGDFSIEEVENHLKNLKNKILNIQDENLRNEYQKSIDQHEKQRKSIEELKNQKEIIDLRLMSSLTSLKQLQIDFARIKGIYSQEDNSSIRSFEETSKDLSNYVENIKNSYRNLERELEY
ncbi:MAG: hypothetical protein A2086_10665 [Spirochaetes bacterium GWD1_27_9]|nr:MAG: hypothetical protein A2Y34_09240 [Spirochaetes bacterium GWC1_27_15]OHD34883.1 MAG: hypothetical protein A2086_10665 [Spirochaetes bacterium GWD1_27_9]